MRLLKIGFLSALFVGSAAAQNRPWFHAPRMITPLTGEFELLGDVDLDGDVDLVAFYQPSVSSTAQNLTVHLNDGTGNFTVGQTLALPAYAGAHGFMADLDGDLRLDVVLSQSNGNPLGPGLVICAGQPGGTFGAPVFVPLPGVVLSMRKGDADGDTIDDLFVTHAIGATVPSRWIHGAPGFALVLDTPQVLTTPLTCAVLDVDSDGIDDVAVVRDTMFGGGPHQVELYRTTATGFAIVGTFPIPSSTGTQIAVLDHDNDGDPDVATLSTTTSAEVTLTVGTNGGSWSATQQTFTGYTTGALFAGDWNGDGRVDLVERSFVSGSVGNGYRSVTPFENLGSGAFAPRYSVSIKGEPLTLGVGLADFNGDGALDFADTNSIFFGDGTMNDPFGGPATRPLTDWDRDGDLDSFDGVTVQKNDGRGVFTAQQLQYPAQPPNFFLHVPVVVDDFDGDGLHEMIAPLTEFVPFAGSQFRSMRLLREQPDGTVIDAGLAAAAGVQMPGGVVVDADGDGDFDVVAEQGVWLNNGAMFFTLGGTPSYGYVPFAAADLDGDTDLDLVADWISGGNSVAVLWRTGPATYTPTVLFAPQTSFNIPPQTAIGDIDDDGDIDIVARRGGFGTPVEILVFTNQLGVFTQAASLAYDGMPCIGDVDGDGRTDLVISAAWRFTVLRRTAPGLVFAPPVVFAGPWTAQHSFADIDQDGDLDLCGWKTVRNRTFEGATAGFHRQYGNGSAGTGGRRPLLSVTGTVRAGLTPSIRLCNVPGATVGVLLVGSGPDNSPSPVLPGIQAYVSGLFLLLGSAATGAPGVPGAGVIEVPVAIPPGIGGTSLFLEYLVFDPASPTSLTHSNGCELHVGQ